MKLSKKQINKTISKRLTNNLINVLLRNDVLPKGLIQNYGRRKIISMLQSKENEYIKSFFILRFIDSKIASRVLRKHYPNRQWWNLPTVDIENNRFVFYDMYTRKHIKPPKRKINITREAGEYALLVNSLFETTESLKTGSFVIELLGVMDYTIRLIRYLARFILKEIYKEQHVSHGGDLEDDKEMVDKEFIGSLREDIRPQIKELLPYLGQVSEILKVFNNESLNENIESVLDYLQSILEFLDMYYEHDERWLYETDFNKSLLDLTDRCVYYCEQTKANLAKIDYKQFDMKDWHHNKIFPYFNSRFVIKTIKSMSASGEVKKYSRKTK